MNLQFQLEYEPRWRGLLESAGIVLRPDRSGVPRQRTSTISARSLAGSVAVHVGVVLALCFGPRLLDRNDHLAARRIDPADYKIYYVPRDLPNVADAGGAAEGRAGARGGSHIYHPRQAIRIARGRAIAPAVVDAPHLRLPWTRDAANLVALLRRAPHATASLVAEVPIELRHADVAVAPHVATSHAMRVSALTPTATPIPPPVTVPKIPALDRPTLPVPLTATVAPPADPIVLRQNAARQADAVAPSSTLVARDGAAPMLPHHAAIPERPAMANPAGTRTPSSTENAGAGDSTAVVISPKPGNSIGAPNASSGMAAMSPAGAGRAGFGGSGGTRGAGTGVGAGIATSGNGTGAAMHGNDAGSSTLARSGVSTAPGPGGAGRGAASGPVPGVSISGNVVEIPSFGGGGSSPAPHRGSVEKTAAPSVVIVATSRAGGGLPEYGLLHGRVYTTYVDTSRGSVVLQFADPAGGSQDFDLTPPQVVNSSLPAQPAFLRTVIACVLERSGAIADVRVIEAAAPEAAAALVRSLRTWKFRPALRGDQAIAVQAILGFGVTTQ
jgi:hypothetical protein